MRQKDSALLLLTFAAPLMAGALMVNADGRQALIERAVDDLMLRMQVNIALKRDAALAATDLQADSRRGVVTLSGSAYQTHLGERAVELAREVDGVQAVRLRLEQSKRPAAERAAR